MEKRTNKVQKVILLFVFAWLIFFVLMPNLLVLGISFLTKDSSNLINFTFSLDSFAKLIDPLYSQVMWNSLVMASITTLVCVIVGYPFAFFLAKLPAKIRPIMMFLLVLPFWTNSLIRIYGMRIFLGVKGVLNNILLTLGIISEPMRILNTEVAVIIGLVYLLLPFMILPIYSSVEKLDLRLLEAAKDLGANAFSRFYHIILPLTVPGIIAGVLLVLLPAMGMFYVADLLGGAKILLVGNVIKTEFLVTRNWPFGAAISIGLTLIMALLIYIYYRVNKLTNKKMELA